MPSFDLGSSSPSVISTISNDKAERRDARHDAQRSDDIIYSRVHVCAHAICILSFFSAHPTWPLGCSLLFCLFLFFSFFLPPACVFVCAYVRAFSFHHASCLQQYLTSERRFDTALRNQLATTVSVRFHFPLPRSATTLLL